MHVAASIATPTTTGVKGGLDVDVTVEINGITCDGEATLVPDEINGGWRAYGPAADYWVSGELLRWIDTLDEGVSREEILKAIESAAAESCERV